MIFKWKMIEYDINTLCIATNMDQTLVVFLLALDLICR